MTSKKQHKVETIKKIINKEFMFPDDPKDWMQFFESDINPGGYRGDDGKEYTLEEMRATPWQVHVGFSLPGIDYKIVFK